MSPELKELLAQAEVAKDFPITQLVELGEAEGWPKRVRFENRYTGYSLPIAKAINEALRFGLEPTRARGVYNVVELSEYVCTTLTVRRWHPVFEAIVAWDRKRRNLEPQPVPAALAAPA